MSNPPGLHVEDLAIRAGDFHLEGLTFSVPEGAYAVLTGPTGSGKTTILESICGLRQIERGKITLGSRRIDTLRPADRIIGYVPQDGALFPTMTARAQIMLPLEVRGSDRSFAAARAEELARLVDIEHLLDRRPSGYSGGERQRVAIARAIAHPPQLLIMDEPVAALDETMRTRVLSALKSVHGSMGITTIHVTHDPRDTEELGSMRLALSNDGTIQ